MGAGSCLSPAVIMTRPNLTRRLACCRGAASTSQALSKARSEDSSTLSAKRNRTFVERCQGLRWPSVARGSPYTV